MDKPIDPKTEMLRVEHDAMIGEIRKSLGQTVSSIVGADGKPIVKDDSGKPKPEGIVVPGTEEMSERERAITAQKEAAAKRRQALSDAISKKCEEDPAFAVLAGQVLLGWRLIRWLSDEMLTFENVSPDMVDYIHMSCRASSISHGFSLAELISTLRSSTVPLLTSKLQHYSDLQRARNERIKRIRKRIDKRGVALPCQTLTDMFKETGFHPGKAIILHGERPAIRLALDACVRTHFEKNGGESYYLSSSNALFSTCTGGLPSSNSVPTVTEVAGDAAAHYMPLSWWSGKAMKITDLEEVLSPVKDSQAILMVVEALEDFVAKGEADSLRTEDEAKLRARAMGNLYQWINENQVCLIIGDVISRGTAVPPDAYKPLPHCAVDISELPDGSKRLVIGNDVLEISK
jgi:hypothetical protein